MRYFVPALLLTATFVPVTAHAVSANYTLGLSVPVICKGEVEIGEAGSGTFIELCNILEPYRVALKHERFDPSRNLVIDYDGTRISLNPDGYTILKTHGRGGRTLRPFRIPEVEEDFIASIRIEASPSRPD